MRTRKLWNIKTIKAIIMCDWCCFTSNLLNYLSSEMGLFALNNCSWFMFIGLFKFILWVLFQSFGYHYRKVDKNGIYVLDNVLTVQFVMWCLFLKVYRHISSQSLSESYLELLLRFCDLNASYIFILQLTFKWKKNFDFKLTYLVNSFYVCLKTYNI